MISADDIAAFAEDTSDDIEAAREYARRYAKGLPTDRYTDGSNGAKAVARGIMAQGAMLRLYAQAMQAILDDQVQRGVEAMSLHDDRREKR